MSGILGAPYQKASAAPHQILARKRDYKNVGSAVIASRICLSLSALIVQKACSMHRVCRRVLNIVPKLLLRGEAAGNNVT